MRPGPILAVDDEPALLRMIEQYLERFGYEVDMCLGAGQALGLFSDNPGRYALVLADVTMPGMSGEELASRLLELNPSVFVLLCSGFPFDLFGFPEEIRRQVRFLQKPFLPRALLRAIEELLGPASVGGLRA